MAQREWDPEEAGEIIARHRDLPGAALPILHALQAAFGYIDKAAVPLIADALNLSRAEVHGIVGFYHDFRSEPPGRHVLRVCRAEACQAMGAERLIAELEGRLGVRLGETSRDRRVTLEAVYCLGNCAASPAALLDGKLHGRLTPQLAERLLGEAGRRP